MRSAGPAIILILLSSVLILAPSPARAGDPSAVTATPSVVEVGISFGGADLHLEGPVPPGAQVAVKISTRPSAVKLSKKSRVMGIFWMTTERAVVENMPAFHAIYASQPVETLLSREEQIRIGADGECEGIMSQARVISDSPESAPLPPQQAREYVVGLRDMYIKSGRYVPCVSCHRTQLGTSVPHSATAAARWDAVQLGQDRWQLDLRLPSDAPLGDYDVTAYYIQAGKVISSQSTRFSVSKSGLVEVLGSMATRNAPAYGALSLVVVVLAGLTIGFVFPKGRH